MDVYPGLLVLLLHGKGEGEGEDIPPTVDAVYRPLCDMHLCGSNAVVTRGALRVCMDHGLLMPRQEGDSA